MFAVGVFVLGTVETLDIYWPEAIWFATGLGFACGGAVQLFPKRVSKYAKPASR